MIMMRWGDAERGNAKSWDVLIACAYRLIGGASTGLGRILIESSLMLKLMCVHFQR